MLCVLTSQVPAKPLEKKFSVTSCIIGIWATNGILSAGAGSSFFHALCGITADDAMLVIVHHRTTGFRCLQRVLPACWEKSRKAGCEPKMWLRWNVSGERWNRQIDQECFGFHQSQVISLRTYNWTRKGNKHMRQLPGQLTTCDKPFHKAPALQGQTIAFSNNGKHKSLLAHLTLLKSLAQGAKENSSSSHGSTCFQKKNAWFWSNEDFQENTSFIGQVASQCSCHTCRSRYWPPARLRWWSQSMTCCEMLYTLLQVTKTN